MKVFASLLALTVLMCFETFTESTKITWRGNPDAPEAAKVPRSQKYWDENNIERPDYAKTDWELAQERLQNKDGEMSYTATLFVCTFFIVLWAFIIKVGMMKSRGGTKLGSLSLGSQGSFFSGLQKKSDYGASFEQKARDARLARFESKKDD